MTTAPENPRPTTAHSEEQPVSTTKTEEQPDRPGDDAERQAWIAAAEDYVRDDIGVFELVPHDHPARTWSAEDLEVVEHDGPMVKKRAHAAAGRVMDAARKSSDRAKTSRMRKWRLDLTRAVREPEFGEASPQRWLTAAQMVADALQTKTLPGGEISGEHRKALDSLLAIAMDRKETLDQAIDDARAQAVAAETERRSTSEAWEQELRDRAEREHQPAPEPEHPTVRDGMAMYAVKGNCTYWNKRTANGTEDVMIATFRADVTEEIKRDDGTDCTLLWKIRVVTCDGHNGEVTIAPNQLSRPQQWATEAAGLSALVMPGMAAADHLRAAVQIGSRENVVRRTVYAHTGWRQLGDRWAYLTGTGALGADGLDESVNVELGAGLDGFALPAVPDVPVLQKAVLASLGLLNLAPDIVTMSLLGSTYRAPLPLNPDTGVWLYGGTGSFKTAITALMQQHFGPAMDAHGLPGNWESTANALEMKAYRCANALFTIDDRAPDHSKADEQRHAAAVDRIFRGSANHAARERMNADGTLRAPKPARAQLLTSAEDVPPLNPSLRARMLVTEVSPGTIDREKLSDAQRQAADGTFAVAMAGYVAWIARQLDTDPGFAKGLADRQIKLRDTSWTDGRHARFALNIASLALGWDLWLDFAVAVGAIDEEQQAAYRNRMLESLAAVGADQVRYQMDSDPVRVYLRTLNSLVAARRAYIADRKTGYAPTSAGQWGWVSNATTGEMQPAQGADLIGWTDSDEDGDVYLQPDVAYRIVRQFAEQSGSPLGKSKSDIHKGLELRGLLATKQGDRNTTKQRVYGNDKPIPLLHLTRAGFTEGAEQ